MTKQIIDLAFPLHGKRIPVDHGFALYGALSRLYPSLHKDENIGVHLIRGRYSGNGFLELLPFSRLRLRIPNENISAYLGLAGKSLDLEGDVVHIGTPTIYPLRPKVALYSHLVTTKNGQDTVRFQEAVRTQLRSVGVQGKFYVGKRRTFKIHDKQIVGYSMLLTELSAEDSLTLQEKGVGGRRKMGCGIFSPVR